MNAKSVQTNPELIEYRFNEQDKKLNELKTSMDSGFEKINKRMDEFTFAPIAVTESLDIRLKAVEEELKTEVVKKSDNKVIKGIGVAVITAMLITLATLLINEFFGGIRA